MTTDLRCGFSKNQLQRHDIHLLATISIEFSRYGVSVLIMSLKFAIQTITVLNVTHTCAPHKVVTSANNKRPVSSRSEDKILGSEPFRRWQFNLGCEFTTTQCEGTSE
jgi:hypothetical protein